MKRVYLDYAASTPVAPEVERAMRPYFLKEFGNAGSLHSFGQKAMAAVDGSRETIAKAIGADFREIIFTGSATEANNLAIRGIAKSIKYQVSSITKPRIIVSAIEHESVLETARDSKRDGVEVVYLPVSKSGIVDLKKLKESLNERTILVSVMYANNEIGTIQPIEEISKIIGEFKARFKTTNAFESTKQRGFVDSDKFAASGRYPLFHTDAVQAFQFLDCDVNKLGVDLMTLSAHKIYGPKGVGALYVRRPETRDQQRRSGKEISRSLVPGSLLPIITGGGQEFGLRSGTENVPLIVGFAKAVSLVAKLREKESKRIGDLRDYLWRELKKIYPKAERNGNVKKVLPNFLNVYFPDYKAEDLLTRFDLADIAVSAGSACSARSSGPSYAIEAISHDRKQSKRSIRITLGRYATRKDIDITLKTVGKLLYK